VGPTLRGVGGRRGAEGHVLGARPRAQVAAIEPVEVGEVVEEGRAHRGRRQEALHPAEAACSGRRERVYGVLLNGADPVRVIVHVGCAQLLGHLQSTTNNLTPRFTTPGPKQTTSYSRPSSPQVLANMRLPGRPTGKSNSRCGGICVLANSDISEERLGTVQYSTCGAGLEKAHTAWPWICLRRPSGIPLKHSRRHLAVLSSCPATLITSLSKKATVVVR